MKNDVPSHVDWNSIDFGSGYLSCVEADEIIEEIMSFKSLFATFIVNCREIRIDMISSIDKEFVLQKRKIGNEVI